MSDKPNSSSGGIGFFGLLTILFIGLKLTGYIDWSWWWVLSPTTIPIALLLTVVVVAGSGWGIVTLIQKRRNNRP